MYPGTVFHRASAYPCAVLLSTVLVFISGLWGDAVLEFPGIQMESLRGAGGTRGLMG